jgi:hypothetical protein
MRSGRRGFDLDNLRAPGTAWEVAKGPEFIGPALIYGSSFIA